MQHRYNKLQTKLQDEAIAPEEYQELRQLIDVVEQTDADRFASPSGTGPATGVDAARVDGTAWAATANQQRQVSARANRYG